MLNEIAETAPEFVLVLDDYHLIEAHPIHDALAFLLDHLPPQAHLVIASRADLPLPLGRLRDQGRLIELRAADLRFKLDEVAAFLNEVMGLGLSAEDIAALETHTEGWIVGLQLAALALRSYRLPQPTRLSRSRRLPQSPLSMQRQSTERIANFIATFTGSHRYILDYLTEEVLHQQPESIQTFLLQTAILDRLTAPLCDAVVGEIEDQKLGSQAILEYLESSNLFITPLDDERRWYRYHHLFTDLLRRRLEQAQPGHVPALHCRASQWYEDNGLIAEALSHALAASDVERAVRRVEENALALLTRKSPPGGCHLPGCAATRQQIYQAEWAAIANRRLRTRTYEPGAMRVERPGGRVALCKSWRRTIQAMGAGRYLVYLLLLPGDGALGNRGHRWRT